VSQVRLDRVVVFGDKLSFLIPHEWIEADDEPGTYLYHAPSADSGWFRVSLITLKETMACSEELRELLADRAKKEGGELYESGENTVVAWEEASEQDGVPICLYWWAVGHCHRASLGREALFSYTILGDRHEDPATTETVALLAQLVADARFTEPKVD
jgi:hypothetical protein